jgi:hypothetical protein
VSSLFILQSHAQTADSFRFSMASTPFSASPNTSQPPCSNMLCKPRRTSALSSTRRTQFRSSPIIKMILSYGIVKIGVPGYFTRDRNLSGSRHHHIDAPLCTFLRLRLVRYQTSYVRKLWLYKNVSDTQSIRGVGGTGEVGVERAEQYRLPWNQRERSVCSDARPPPLSAASES